MAVIPSWSSESQSSTSTAVDMSGKRAGGIDSGMTRQYPTSWVHDSRYPSRDPALHPPQFHDQPPQNLRLPPPTSPVPGAHGSHIPSQMQSPHDPGFGVAYQSVNVPTSTQQVSHPPLASGRPASQHSRGMSSSQQSQYGLQLPERPPPDPYSDPRGARQIFHTHQMPRTQEYSIQGSAPSAYAYAAFAPRPIQPRLPPNLDPATAMEGHSENRSDPMRISDILSGDSASTDGRPPSESDIKYVLKIRQQPVAARSCGFGERDRRVIDPPPIVQLSIECAYLSEDDIKKRLRYCHYIMSCSILDESGTRDAIFMPEEYRQQRRLMGSLVGAPFVGKDENDVEGCFFCFPDLSCRTPGSFRLKFSLVMIEPAKAHEVKHFPVLVEAKSEVFTVYSAKDFPGMQASTKLTKRLKEQGCIISIKKGNDKLRTRATNIEDSSDGEPDEEGESSQGRRYRRASQR